MYIIGICSSFIFILLTSIIFDRFVLENHVFSNGVTGLLYCLSGGLIALLLQLGESQTIPEVYVWVAVKGFGWTGIFLGLVDIVRTRRLDRDLQELRVLLSDISRERIREEVS